MIEELGLDNGQWELFSINDNASNVKLGIQLSSYLEQYFCSIHTLELGVKDTFKNVPGMQAVVIKTKALGKFTHKSTVANEALKNEAKKENVRFKQLVNPPNTRWSGYHDNLASVLYMKKPLMNLMASQDALAEHELSAGDWKLIEGAVQLLKPVRCTIKIWEAEKEPTMHTVIERLYSMHSIIDEFIASPRNNRFEKRFPNTGTDEKLRRIANYLAPQYKGIHLEATKKLGDTKEEIKQEVMDLGDDHGEPELEIDDIDVAPLSPTSRLRKQFLDKQQRAEVDGFLEDRITPIEREIRRYEAFSLPPKTVDILQWWKSHEKVLPLLSNMAKKVLTVPASSSKSERVFSCGGNIVTSKRNKLAPQKVENLVIIKENKAQIEEFKKRGSYKLEDSRIRPFGKISVDQVLADLQIEEAEDMFAEDLFESAEEDVNVDSDEESEDEEIVSDDDSDFDIDI